MAWIFQIKEKDILSRILSCHLGNQDQCLEVCCGGPAATSYLRGTTAPCAKEHLTSVQNTVSHGKHQDRI